MQFLLQNAVFAAKCSFCCKCSFFALPITVASWKDWKRKKKMSEKIKSRNAYVFTGIQYKVIYLHNVQNEGLKTAVQMYKCRIQALY